MKKNIINQVVKFADGDSNTYGLNPFKSQRKIWTTIKERYKLLIKSKTFEETVLTREGAIRFMSWSYDQLDLQLNWGLPSVSHNGNQYFLPSDLVMWGAYVELLIMGMQDDDESDYEGGYTIFDASEKQRKGCFAHLSKKVLNLILNHSFNSLDSMTQAELFKEKANVFGVDK